ncbi:Ni,Fe-hydrogenase I large subunit [Bradyrhizobium sp. RT9b]
MEQRTRALRLSEPFCDKSRELPDGSYVGLVEAARGSLGHWMAVRDGKIERYQIIAPTIWNFSPRDSFDVGGPLERALVGTDVGDAGPRAVAIQHIVRSFAPCMVCTRALTGNFVAGCKSNCVLSSCWQRPRVPFMKVVQIRNVMESLHF